MRKLSQKVVEALERGENTVLVTVLESHGSAPRGIGACMLVYEDGTTVGTVGGGKVEYAATVEATRHLHDEGCFAETYNLTNNEAGSLGMVCGGEVSVLFQPIAPGTEIAATFRRLAEEAERECPVCLVRRYAQGRLVESQVTADAPPRPRLDREGDGYVLYEPVCSAGCVYVFGGGHVSQALAPLLSSIDFRVIVYEDREEFAQKVLFPTAEAIVLGRFTEVSEKISIKRDDYVVIMTRGHQNDYEILAQALKTDAAYIGCIGSRHKVAYTKERLIKDGFTEEEFARVRAPIGLDIGAETPAEIAVSIAGQLIAHRAGISV